MVVAEVIPMFLNRLWKQRIERRVHNLEQIVARLMVPPKEKLELKPSRRARAAHVRAACSREHCVARTREGQPCPMHVLEAGATCRLHPPIPAPEPAVPVRNGLDHVRDDR